MRHASPRERRWTRINELIFCGIAYTIAALTTAITALAGGLAVWALWNWMGVA